MPAARIEDAALIAVDWGTTRCRAMLLDRAGAVIAEADSADGIGALGGSGHEDAFNALVADWPKVPAIMAGMVGSRQGWHEAAYVAVPTSADALGGQLLRFQTSDHRPVAIVPGLVLRSETRDGDVIRGEETQLVGLIEEDPDFNGIVILPGTHSKWAVVAKGGIVNFQTFMTGEMFELLARKSFLRHSVAEDADDLAGTADFALAVRRTAVEDLPFLGAIFSVRVRQLLNGVSGDDNLAYLSGLVIGGEIAAARQMGLIEAGRPIRIVGSRTLARAYVTAFNVAGLEAEAKDGSALVRRGLVRLARANGLL
ncbi:2-dehydro-3-deoxygalactonokinase [Kaistia dalseonensis]|uniref:2-dehydro-3-deoxygalactonokinase n=1 Tax=Kaistia dalseonensis TaxID=410840 RepID=A0ABU0H870_9HYPH|nr:2-dehydro-3-deoxygalactonokinase [Kaistia dalseonensis]MCX5495901.1 2-dehydro-3-deoxygalactonokinase [Kaistia dalseonensis]MDQ0438504.1 2-dehydro-3-deoxygalactonokinase [Kaistia dalseonensis]